MSTFPFLSMEIASAIFSESGNTPVEIKVKELTQIDCDDWICVFNKFRFRIKLSPSFLIV